MPKDTVRANAQAMPIDRRAALSSLAAAGAAIMATPRIANAADASEAKLLDLEARLAAADAKLAPLDKALWAARGAIRQEAGFEPRRASLNSKSRRHIRRAEREHVAAVKAWKLAQADAETRHNLADLTEAHVEASALVSAIEREIWETQAETFEGLRIKGRMARLKPGLAYSIVTDVGGYPPLPKRA